VFAVQTWNRKNHFVVGFQVVVLPSNRQLFLAVGSLEL